MFKKKYLRLHLLLLRQSGITPTSTPRCHTSTSSPSFVVNIKRAFPFDGLLGTPLVSVLLSVRLVSILISNFIYFSIAVEDDVTSTSATSPILETVRLADTVSSSESDANAGTSSLKIDEIVVMESNVAPTFPPTNPTYMTIKVKGKNRTATRKEEPSASSTTATATAAIRITAATSIKESDAGKPFLPFLNTSAPAPSLSTALKFATESSTKFKFINHHSTTTTTTEKAYADYDSGFSLENMLSFLFDEPPVLSKTRNTVTAPPKTFSSSRPTTSTSTWTTWTAETKIPSTVHRLTAKTTTEASPAEARNEILSTNPSKVGTDSAIYVIKNENTSPKIVLNYGDDGAISIRPINSYYVPPLGNFEEVILNPTSKPFSANKKPSKGSGGGLFSTTPTLRHTTAKVSPLSRPPSEKHVPLVLLSGDPGVASGFLKLSGCNIFGKMYRVGKIIAELSGPCLQCMCAEVGVQCVPLKC